MNDNFEKNLENLKRIRMSETERQQTRRNILAMIEERNGGATRHISWREKLKSVFTIKKLSMPAIVLALVLALSGGTAAAASTALPGDALYPVKTEINEKVAAAFHFSEESKGQFKIKLAERRLEEAEKLAAKGELNSELIAKLQTKFDNHSERMQAIVDKLEAAGKHEQAAKLSSNLEASLEAHSQILEKLKAKVESGDTTIDKELVEDLMATVKDKHVAISKIRAVNEVEIKPEMKSQAAENVREMSKKQIENVKQHIAKAEEKLGAEAVADAKVSIAAAETLWAEAVTKVEAQAYADAFTLFQQAHRKAMEAKLLIKANDQLREKLMFRMQEKAQVRMETKSKVEADQSEVETENEVEVEVEVGL